MSVCFSSRRRSSSARNSPTKNSRSTSTNSEPRDRTRVGLIQPKRPLLERRAPAALVPRLPTCAARWERSVCREAQCPPRCGGRLRRFPRRRTVTSTQNWRGGNRLPSCRRLSILPTQRCGSQPVCRGGKQAPIAAFRRPRSLPPVFPSLPNKSAAPESLATPAPAACRRGCGAAGGGGGPPPAARGGPGRRRHQQQRRRGRRRLREAGGAHQQAREEGD